jgi:hypothetical protein
VRPSRLLAASRSFNILKEETFVDGTVLRKFESANGLCYDLELVTPVWLTGQETSEVGRGNLTRLRMALQALGMEKRLVGDVIELECTALQPTNRGDDRIDFKIHIDRPDEPPFGTSERLTSRLSREGYRKYPILVFAFREDHVSVPSDRGRAMSIFRCVCDHCNDVSDLVSPFNGSTVVARTTHCEVIVALHTRCEQAWADKNSCRTLVPLRKRRRQQSAQPSSSGGVH